MNEYVIHARVKNNLILARPQAVEVLRLRMKEDMTFPEIGEKLGLSHSRIAQIEAQALRKMRGAAVRLGIEDCYTGA